MIFDYSPTGFGVLRPLLDIKIGAAEFDVKALVDSGSVNSLFPSWVAREAGIDLSGGSLKDIRVGGISDVATFVKVQMKTAGLVWEADVGFCSAVTDWGLLGHESFFRYFEVNFRAADSQFEVIKIEE